MYSVCDLKKFYQAPLKFTGITLPYKTATHAVYPLLTDISQKNIDYLTQQLQQKKPLGEGANGKAYAIPSPFEGIKGDIIVKVHKGKAAFQQDDLKEIQCLDLLESLSKQKKSLHHSQRGLVAFKPEGGMQHVVSTYVPGDHPDKDHNPITNKALHLCMEQIIALEKGTPEHGRFLHCDFKSANMSVSSNSAGFYDWDNLQVISLKESILRGAKREAGFEKYHDYINEKHRDYRRLFTIYDTADTFPFKTNLKHFESRVIAPYLGEFIQAGQKKEGRRFLQQYLQEKAYYHRSMQSHYAELAKEIEQKASITDTDTLEYKRLLHKISRSEGIHANLLEGENNQTPKDILKAELYKMQLSHSAWRSKADRQLIDFNGKKMPINGKQIGTLFDRSKSYFQECFALAKSDKDVARKRYYKNCLMLIRILDKYFNVRSPKVESDEVKVGQSYNPALRAMNLDGPPQKDFEEELYRKR